MISSSFNLPQDFPVAQESGTKCFVGPWPLIELQSPPASLPQDNAISFFLCSPPIVATWSLGARHRSASGFWRYLGSHSAVAVYPTALSPSVIPFARCVPCLIRSVSPGNWSQPLLYPSTLGHRHLLIPALRLQRVSLFSERSFSSEILSGLTSILSRKSRCWFQV